LTAEHAAKRLACTKIHKAWDKEEWEGVIFSDECSVEKSKGQRGIWVFRTPSEKKGISNAFTGLRRDRA
jgi:hypothetical protein